MVKILIGLKYCVRHLNEKILNYFIGSSSTTNEPISRLCVVASVSYKCF